MEEWKGQTGWPYLRIQIVYPFDRSLDITGVDGLQHINPFLHRRDIRLRLDIGFRSEFARGRRVAIGDEVVHH